MFPSINFCVSGLKKGTEYQVRICAQTVNGTGPFTAWMTATTFKEEFRGEWKGGEGGERGRE